MPIPNHTEPGVMRLRTFLGCFAVIVVVFSALNVFVPEAEAAPRTSSHRTVVEPYGGCDEAWQAPRSPGAQWCRDHGWVVKRNFVIDPDYRAVRYLNLGPCKFEDSRGCYWNARVRGDGHGRSFVIGWKGRAHFVLWRTLPRH